jgi:hypothetical protein
MATPQSPPRDPSGRRHAPPKAAAMIEALRGLGYSTASALADIIDNSISAGAQSVDITFRWDRGDASVAVEDDGRGMDSSQLDAAMRLGERSPLDHREATDLGRFGLGLKTASFSQCRRLTVASRQDGVMSCLRWDLDVLASADGDGWYLLEGPDGRSVDRLKWMAERQQGTLVLWEGLDRIVTPGFREQDFLDLIDGVERHLAMVFQRYLNGPRPRLRLRINAREVEPWDPFLAAHPASWASPEDRIPSSGGSITVQCHVLPHRDRLTSVEYDGASGPHGWTAQQGFYIYRQGRLLVAGSWLGLGRGRSWTKEESHRLARISIDLPNTADVAWKIDIRKASARPPVEIRERLTRLAEDARDRARRVFAHRGSPATLRGEPVVQAWRVERLAGGVRYRVDESHEAVSSVLQDAGALRPRIEAMLRVIEATLPVQRIWLDTADARETPRGGLATEHPKEVAVVLRTLFRSMIDRRGLQPAAARERLLRMEPFDQHPEMVLALGDDTVPQTTD